MGQLRHEEVRRLLRHLQERIEDTERLAQIEEELRGEFAEEFLREPNLLIYFPEITDEFVIANSQWKLRYIPHVHLRMVQRGLKQADLSALFRRFIETHIASEQIITIGSYSIWGRPRPRASIVTLRADVDVVTDESGQAHVVTVFMGRGDIDDLTEVGPI